VPGIAQAQEPVPVEAFVAQPSLKALHEGVLHRLARFDEAQPDAPLVRPLIDRLARQLRTIVQDDLVGATTLGHQPLQHPHHPPAWQGGIDLDRQCFPREDIHDGEKADPAAPSEDIAHEINAPLLVGSFR
jgi:hypothetical protein